MNLTNLYIEFKLIKKNIISPYYYKEEFDLKNINDAESTNLIIEIFKQINFNQKTIFNFYFI